MGQLTRNEVFTLAVQRYSDTVYRTAVHNCRCTADAEDVVQDIFEKLLHYNGIFESEEHLKAWLLRVAINRCRDPDPRRPSEGHRAGREPARARCSGGGRQCAGRSAQPCRKTTAMPSICITTRGTRRRRSAG